MYYDVNLPLLTLALCVNFLRLEFTGEATHGSSLSVHLRESLHRALPAPTLRLKISTLPMTSSLLPVTSSKMLFYRRKGSLGSLVYHESGGIPKAKSCCATSK